MATNIEFDYAPSPTNEDSDFEDDSHANVKPKEEDSDEEVPGLSEQKSNNNVARILEQLQSAGALIRKPKQEYYCHTCEENFSKKDEFEKHLLKHVSLPVVLLDKLPSDDESETAQSGEDWSDEEEAQITPRTPVKGASQKIDISQILNKTGISIKRPGDNKPTTSANTALSKLSGLGFTITKGSTPIKQEKFEPEKDNDLMQKLGKLGGIKLKLKSDGDNTNSFKVVNGLKDFKTSDDEDEGSGVEEEQEQESDEESDVDKDKFKEEDKSESEQKSEDEHNSNTSRKNSESDENIESALPNRNLSNTRGKNIQIKLRQEVEPIKGSKSTVITKPSQPNAIVQAKPSRPIVKQTPKRSEGSQEILKSPTYTESTEVKEPPSHSDKITAVSYNQNSANSNKMEDIVVKKEIESEGQMQSALPLFVGQIKTEKSSPPPFDAGPTPMISKVKTENDSQPTPKMQPIFSSQNNESSESLMPVPKQEEKVVTIIEINGDSNDEDDDCCVVSTTPAPDIKPIIPKTENPTYPPPYTTSQPSLTTTSTPVISARAMNAPPTPSTEKQHNFNWNAPDTKPIGLDILEKSADDIFDSLFSSSTKKESMSISDTNEYISLDKLGSQHTCDICNTRFTDISLLENHIRMTGHTKSIITPSSSMLPYNPQASSLISNLLPVKQLAEQVGKLSGMGNNGAGAFTHQQNVMINIQAYPGASGMIVPPQTYNAYGQGQTPSGYQGTSTNPMYQPASQPVPGQTYSGQYMGQQGYGQPYQPAMSKAGFPVSAPTTVYSSTGSSLYSAASPLQSMQQAVYGQAPSSAMNPVVPPQAILMGPPGPVPSTSHQFIPSSSSGGTATPSGIRIQNVQTFAPGQLVPPMPGVPGSLGGMAAPGSLGGPGQIRVNNPTVAGPRPRMAIARGSARPSIRPGIQVHGQSLRGAKAGSPRMSMKRGAAAGGGPQQKRRNDMLLPGKHDNEDCQVMAMQKQREGLPMIHSVQGAKDKLNLGSQISITKKTVNKEANAMANVLASRGIMVKQKQKSRSPSPERPLPHIPNLGEGMSIKHTSKTSNFTIPEAKVGSGMNSCKICRKMFMNQNSLAVHMKNAHPWSKLPAFRCDECPASYPKSLQLQHHKRVMHNVTGPNRELGIPVVDLSQEDSLKRLNNLGIYSFIPLANKEQGNGCFGIPIISMHNAQNGITNSLQALGADGLLSLGPLKSLPNI